MYHTLAQEEAVNIVERHAELKNLAKEIHHNFGAQVMSYNKQRLDSNIKDIDKSDPRYDYLKHNTEQIYGRILMCKENGLPFCAINTIKSSDRSGNIAIEYGVTAPFIKKDRGRGNDRHHRASLSLKNLMKTIIKDEKANPVNLIAEVVDGVRNNVEGLARDSRGVRYSNDIHMASDTLVNLLLSRFENAQLSQQSLDDMSKTYALYKKNVEKRAEADEIVKRFYADCYLLLFHYYSPTVVTKIKTLTDPVTGKPSLTGFGESKCYGTMDALAADYPDLAVSLKMFSTKEDHRSKRSNYENRLLYEINDHLPVNTDKLDDQLDIVTYYNSFNTLSDFDHYQAILTPVNPYAN